MTYLIKTVDDGTTKTITGFLSTAEGTYDEKRFMEVSEEVYNAVKGDFIYKSITFPSGETPTVQNLSIQDKDRVLEDLKNTAMHIYKQRATKDIMSLEFIGAVIMFIKGNNEMAAQNIFIGESNREEKYLEILNTGDETTISNLEKYLHYYDIMKDYEGIFTQTIRFRSELDSMSTEEEVIAHFRDKTGEDLIKYISA